MHYVRAGSNPVLGTLQNSFRKMIRTMFASIKVERVLVFFLLLPFAASAQQVIVCKTQQSGVPRESAIEWKVDSFPQELTLFYHNGKTTISERSLNFIIEPEKRLGLEPFEASIVVSQGRNWAATPFLFTRAGKYVISAYRADKTVMATTLISIDGPENQEVAVVTEAPVVKTEPAVSSPTVSGVATNRPDNVNQAQVQVAPSAPVQVAVELTAEEQKTLKFEEVNIAFGTGVSGRKLTAPGSAFTDVQTRKGIVVQLSNTKPFGVGSVAIDIWRKAPGASDFDEMIVNQTVNVNAKDYTVQAPITLYKKGEYKVSFFTPDFVWIGSAYLTVN